MSTGSALLDRVGFALAMMGPPRSGGEPRGSLNSLLVLLIMVIATYYLAVYRPRKINAAEERANSSSLTKRPTVRPLFLFFAVVSFVLLLAAYVHRVERNRFNATIQPNTAYIPAVRALTDDSTWAPPPAPEPSLPEAPMPMPMPVPVVNPQYGEQPEHQGNQTHASFREVTEGLPFTVTSWGGAISSARLRIPTGCPPVRTWRETVLEWWQFPALAVNGVPALSHNVDYLVEVDETNRIITAQTATPYHLHFHRSFRLSAPNTIVVTDMFVNGGSLTVTLPDYSLQLGTIGQAEESFPQRQLRFHFAKAQDRAIPQHLGSEIKRMFSATRARPQPIAVMQRIDAPILWAAIENGSIFQVIIADNQFAGLDIMAERKQFAQTVEIESLSGRVLFNGFELAPQQSMTNRVTLYVGPRHTCPVRIYTWMERLRSIAVGIVFGYILNLPFGILCAGIVLLSVRKSAARKGKLFVMLCVFYPLLLLCANAIVVGLFMWGVLPNLFVGMLPVAFPVIVQWVVCIAVVVLAGRWLTRRHRRLCALASCLTNEEDRTSGGQGK